MERKDVKVGNITIKFVDFEDLDDLVIPEEIIDSGIICPKCGSSYITENHNTNISYKCELVDGIIEYGRCDEYGSDLIGCFCQNCEKDYYYCLADDLTYFITKINDEEYLIYLADLVFKEITNEVIGKLVFKIIGDING